jgi:hypothetical protein
MEHRKLKTAKVDLTKRSNAGELTIPDLTQYDSAIATTQHDLTQDWNIEHWNSAESPEITPSGTCHLIFDKGAKHIQREKMTTLISGAGKTGIHM